MRMNEKKFFALAKDEGFDAADLTINESSSLSVSIFHSNVDSLTNNSSFELVARGIYKGKMGSVSVDHVDKNSPEFLVKEIKRSASIIENDDPVFIFKGSEKYHKKNVFSNIDFGGNVQEKVQILLDIEKRLLAYDKRINEVVTVGFEAETNSSKKTNSYGLKLSQKKNTYAYFAEVTAKDGEEIRTGFSVFASKDEAEFKIDEFVEKVAKDALQKLGAQQCESKKYPIVLNPECVASLMSFLISSLDAEEVQKHTSLLEGKLHQQALSKKLTVIENPLEKNIFFRYFDDEGVATNKKYLIKKGVIETYLYTLQTAAKAGVEPTGNGAGAGKAGAGTGYTIVKGGKKSEEEMLSSIKEGVYLTELTGLHSGMNAQSGNFSLQCAGFMIRDGKKADPLALITVAGNLLNVFSNIKCIANNNKLVISNQMSCPSILVGKLTISGK
ncbi:MAG: TldD/PmbA family protein [Bacilli bacterium]|nr:TldD/PmbA family protein [Bacilli bacterium]